MTAQRSILHVDMDAYYASIEQRDNPELRNKPVAVGGGSNRGVVAAASYEAREFGVRSALPMRDALRRCPDLIRVAPRMAHYKAVSEQVFDIFRDFTPTIEGLSLDEAFLDVSGSLALFGTDIAIATEIKRRIRDELNLTASVGVAQNKLVAKIASDLDKPDGLVVITESTVAQTLDPLPVRVLPGIGKETLKRLHAVGIHSISELRCAPNRKLEAIFGRFAQRTRDRASGIDDRTVARSSVDKSISAEETFSDDLVNANDMHRELLRLTERTSRRLRAKQITAGTIQLKIRVADFTTYTRQRPMHPPSNSTDALYEAGKELLNRWMTEHPGTRIRLLGVGGCDLGQTDQADLFAAQTSVEGSPLDQMADQIRDRFGDSSMARARSLNSD